ncbi:MAG TPA: zinc ribbon domain-containing protein [Anaerolineales bacterium]|nr:zinc ribbon domain-containing protein [Anaerolineales bacterium]
MDVENPRHWRLRQPRYRLIGSVCERCGQPVFPPRPLCPDCAGAREPAASEDKLAEALFLSAGWMAIFQEHCVLMP